MHSLANEFSHLGTEAEVTRRGLLVVNVGYLLFPDILCIRKDVCACVSNYILESSGCKTVFGD